MRVRLESAEVQTLQADGKPWDGFGRARLPREELPRFFALGLTAQLERLVATGEAPNPPDVAVRVLVDGKTVLESDPVESFDPTWPDAEPCELPAGARVRVEVLDLDLALDDVIGATTARVPEAAGDGRWTLPPFGQVRRLVFRLG